MKKLDDKTVKRFRRFCIHIGARRVGYGTHFDSGYNQRHTESFMTKSGRIIALYVQFGWHEVGFVWDSLDACDTCARRPVPRVTDISTGG